MSNNRSRESLNEKDRTFLPNGDRIENPRFVDIKRFQSVGFSMIFTAKAKVDGRNGIKAGDTVYFKVNNTRGVNHLGRTEESMGSCEDVAEVFGYYLLRDLSETLGDKAVLIPTPYDFAEYSHDDFWKLIRQQTAAMVESSRLYGCVSKNIIPEGSEIMHGHLILGLTVPQNNVMKSSSNTIYNYQQGSEEFCRMVAKQGKQAIVSPLCARYDVNMMFWDWFFANSDRHCKNVTRLKTILPNGDIIIEPTAILDNGGGLALQHPNCDKLYREQATKIQQDGKITQFQDGLRNPFCPGYDFSAGAEMFHDKEIAEVFNTLTTSEQIVMLISQNKVLFNDFKNMYQNLNTQRALETMRKETRFNPEYLPNFPNIVENVIKYKKETVSKVMAGLLGEEFDEQKFGEDDCYYLNKFEQIVKEDELSIHIATDFEIEIFNEQIKKLKEQAQKKQ